MRWLGLIILGVAIGAVGTVMALNALMQGREFPDGVMALMGHHLQGLRDEAQAGRCDSEDARRHAATLRLVAHDIEPAFLPTGGDDELFQRYAGKLRDAAATAEAAVGGSCPELAEAAGAVVDGCKACHRDFRG